VVLTAGFLDVYGRWERALAPGADRAKAQAEKAHPGAEARERDKSMPKEAWAQAGCVRNTGEEEEQSEEGP
jgi:hypothetical protein